MPEDTKSMTNVQRAAEALRDHDRKAGAAKDWPAYLAEAERLAVALAAFQPRPALAAALRRPSGVWRG